MRPFANTHVLPLQAAVANAKKESLGGASLFKFRAALIGVAYILRLAQFIHRNNIDLVHTNSLKADLLGGVAARLSGRPVVWHVRDRIDDDYLPRSVVRTFRILSRWIPQFVIANSDATLRSLYPGKSQPGTSFPSVFYPRSRNYVVHDGTFSPVLPNTATKQEGRFRI